MLTLLLTLKDRYDYTEHILHYFNKKKFRYPIIIADGSTIENQEKLKGNLHVYSDIDVTLQNYKPDVTFSDFYLKLITSANTITTKYTLLIDNDDYFSEEGCNAAIEFLEANSDFVAAGQICQFINIDGKIYFPNLRHVDYDKSDVEERVREYLLHPRTIWGLITRTKAIQDSLALMYECDFKYLHLNELLFNLMINTSGKIKYLYNNPCTFRRMITTESSSSSFLANELHYNFYYKNFFYDDWSKLVDAISKRSSVDLKLMEKYWFEGCMRGYIGAKASARKRWKEIKIVKKIYYMFKYPRNWSEDVCLFDRELKLKKF